MRTYEPINHYTVITLEKLSGTGIDTLKLILYARSENSSGNSYSGHLKPQLAKN